MVTVMNNHLPHPAWFCRAVRYTQRRSTIRCTRISTTRFATYIPLRLRFCRFVRTLPHAAPTWLHCVLPEGPCLRWFILRIQRAAWIARDTAATARYHRTKFTWLDSFTQFTGQFYMLVRLRTKRTPTPAVVPRFALLRFPAFPRIPRAAHFLWRCRALVALLPTTYRLPRCLPATTPAAAYTGLLARIRSRLITLV